MRIADSPVEIVVGQVLWSIEDPATGDAGTRMMSEADLVEMLGGDEFVRSSLATRRPGGIPMFVTLSEGDTYYFDLREMVVAGEACSFTQTRFGTSSRKGALTGRR